MKHIELKMLDRFYKSLSKRFVSFFQIKDKFTGYFFQLNASCGILLTGTPIQNNLSKLYALLSFCTPKIFHPKHHENFVQYFRNINTDEGNWKSRVIFVWIWCLLNIDRKKILIDLLKLFVLRQLKCDALTHLPNKTELIIFHDLSKVQKELYKALLTKNRC